MHKKLSVVNYNEKNSLFPLKIQLTIKLRKYGNIQNSI
ncbi:hypothetical protein A1OE_1015 [Candidatus Endolissoclinum faulkneri L2]|uniref:Uncharacterized protein n=1 Tax=Candidatus Endolissoclinum faulkneri L2 TaxID=1193729 RepID=K7YRL5_9PROT|nr:hypothetical protein A1OE_1015 [Candidatus Endolissoclinum faulkneri L2]